MGLKNLFVCDRCGHQQYHPDQMWYISLFVIHCDRPQPDRSTAMSGQGRYKTMWCRKCVDELKLLNSTESFGKPPGPNPEVTIEGMIKEVVRTTIAEEYQS